VRGARTTTTTYKIRPCSREVSRTIEFSPSFLFCSVGGEASARERKQRRLLTSRHNSPPFCVGGEASARELSLSLYLSLSSQRTIELSPSFAVWGGSLLLAKGNQGAFSERNRILPLFCMGGEGSAHELSLSLSVSLSLSLTLLSAR